MSGLWQGVRWASGAWAWAECWVCGVCWVRGRGQSAGCGVCVGCVGVGRVPGLWQGVGMSGVWRNETTWVEAGCRVSGR